MTSSNRPGHDIDAEHTPDAIRKRLMAGPTHSYLRDFIYGAIDGTVTTFAIVAGVAGADLSTAIVLILGVANLVGDGFSMAASNFLGTRAEQQIHQQTRRTEELHIALMPEGEREEIRQIFAAKGFRGADLERVVEVITADRERWVDTMLKEEHGIPTGGPSPLRAAFSTFTAFVLVGVLPLVAFMYEEVSSGSIKEPFIWSAGVTGLAFFAIGAIKGKVVGQRWYTAGAETLAVGGAAAGLAFLVGVLLKGIVDTI